MVSTDIQTTLPSLIEGAQKWVKKQEAEILKRGAPLSWHGREIALAVGVQNPDQVRLLLVRALPKPKDPVLSKSAEHLGLFSPDMTGMTFGHGIVIRFGHQSHRLLAHELRHVHQVERFGSVDSFIHAYLTELVSFGYAGAPLEIDARAQERRWTDTTA